MQLLEAAKKYADDGNVKRIVLEILVKVIRLLRRS